MRLQLKISPSREIVPYDHINILAGALHKWLGPNEEHDGLSLYSFSWLQGSQAVPSKGFLFPKGADWFISSIDGDFLLRSIEGIFADPAIRWGMRVEEVTMRVPPVFEIGRQEHYFRVASPVFYKKRLDDGQERHFLFSDLESDELLTQNMQYKLEKSGLDASDIYLRFDRDYHGAKTKLIKYGQKYSFRSSHCPIIMVGTPEQLAFAWSVGVGQNTGLGFGSLI